MVMNSVNFGKQGLQGLYACLIDCRLIGAGCIKISGQLVDAAFWVIRLGGNLVEYLLELVLVRFASSPAAAPTVHRSRYRISGPPCAVRVLVEIRAGICFSVEVCDLDALERLLPERL